MPKPLKKIKSGLWSRSLSLASFTLGAGARAASHGLSNLMGNEDKGYWVEQAISLTKQLGELKGSVMKAGQMLSVYGEHFLPKEVNLILKQLQFESPPLEWEEIKKIINRSLGKERAALLEIEEEAIACASLGQVHRAKIKATGKQIVLKIQYPGLDTAIDSDIRALKKILSLSRIVPKLPAMDTLFLEIKSMLKQELDYELEKNELEFFREKLAADSRYLVPMPIAEFCTKRILAMEYLPGARVDGPEVKALSQERRNRLGLNTLSLYLDELFLYHAVQTDPHFGNYRISIDSKGEDKIILYDFGAVRRLPDEFVEKYRKMLAAVFFQKQKDFEKAAMSLGMLEPQDPEELRNIFFRLCSQIVEPFSKPNFDWGNDDLPKRVTRTTAELFKGFDLRAPRRELVFLDRKMTGMYIFLSVLDVRIDASKILKPHLEK